VNFKKGKTNFSKYKQPKFFASLIISLQRKMKSDDLDIDKVIDKLLEVRGCKPGK